MRYLGRVLVLDDAALVRQAVCLGVGEAGYVVMAGTAESEIRSVIDTFEPDVIVARLDGAPAERVPMLHHGMHIPLILVASEDASPSQRVEARRAGADSVFTEPIHVDELVARVDVLMEHRRTHHVVTVYDLNIDKDAHVVRRNDVELQLTVTEYNLLLDLAANVGVVLSKRQILERVWGFDEYEVNLVEVHISALRRKLEAAGPRLIQTVRGFGYDPPTRLYDGASAYAARVQGRASGGSHPLIRRSAG